MITHQACKVRVSGTLSQRLLRSLHVFSRKIWPHSLRSPQQLHVQPDLLSMCCAVPSPDIGEVVLGSSAAAPINNPGINAVFDASPTVQGIIIAVGARWAAVQVLPSLPPPLHVMFWCRHAWSAGYMQAS